tara:strand:+ start:476 stop:1237 length:762 start_codon:yes stop_codon:yes gene_type:complete
MKYLLSLVFILPFIVAQAQDSIQNQSVPPQYNANAGDLGVTVNITGLINNISSVPRKDLRAQNSLVVRYVINDNLTFRTGIAPRVVGYRVSSTDSVGKDLVEFDSTARQSSFSIRPGIEYHFLGTKRLDPYAALDAEFGVIGWFNAGSNTNISDTTGTSKYKRTITEAGGFGLGAKLSLGFNYFVAKRLALGLEYGMGLAYTATGGDKQEVLQIDPTSGSASTQRQLSSTRVFDTQLFVDPMAQFTLSYFFSL